jgi:predicted DNA-binding protein
MATNKTDLKNRIRITSSLDKELVQKLKELSASTSIPQSKLLDRGIELVLAEYKDFKKE